MKLTKMICDYVLYVAAFLLTLVDVLRSVVFRSPRRSCQITGSDERSGARHVSYTFNDKTYVIIERDKRVQLPLYTEVDPFKPAILSAVTDSGKDVTSIVARYAGPEGDFHSNKGFLVYLRDVSNEAITITTTNFDKKHFKDSDAIITFAGTIVDGSTSGRLGSGTY